MTREEKYAIVEDLAGKLKETSHFYMTDTSELNAEKTTKLRRACFKKQIKLIVIKNTLLKKAFDKLEEEKDFSELDQVLKGHTALMLSEVGNAPAKLIKDFRKREKTKKPLLKAAYVEESFYLGEEQLEALVNIKSKEELIADLIALLQSPVKQVMSSLQSGSNVLTGVLETLSKKEEQE